MSVPLDEQVRLYNERFEREVDRLHDSLEDENYLDRIHLLGVRRLIEGYDTFGDAMYGWSSDKRQAEQDEELADFFVYGSSEE